MRRARDMIRSAVEQVAGESACRPCGWFGRGHRWGASGQSRGRRGRSRSHSRGLSQADVDAGETEDRSDRHELAPERRRLERGGAASAATTAGGVRSRWGSVIRHPIHRRDQWIGSLGALGSGSASGARARSRARRARRSIRTRGRSSSSTNGATLERCRSRSLQQDVTPRRCRSTVPNPACSKVLRGSQASRTGSAIIAIAIAMR
jgi:hypothetical protein